MPVGEQAAGRSLGTIFYPARHTARLARGQLWHLIPRFLHGRGLSNHSRFRGCDDVLGDARTFFANLVTPGKFLFSPFEAGEIAAAGWAAVGVGAQAQQKPRPSRRIIVMLLPFCQFLTIAAGTTRVPPGAFRPDAGFPAIIATAAAEARNAH